jgi:hypothetical protein
MRRHFKIFSGAALAFALLVPAYARTNVPGIPLECRAEVYQVAPDPAATPRKLDSFEMYGAWSFGAYSMSYDRKYVFFERFHGVAFMQGTQPSVEYDVPHMTSRYILWAPDNRTCVMSMANGTVLINPATLDPKGGAIDPPTAGCTMLYKAPKTSGAYGGCWAPDGAGYFILEEDATRKVPGSKLKLFPPSGGGSGKTIIDHPTRIGYFMTPNSWFADGSGNATSRPYEIVFGASDGFFISDSSGKVQEKLEGVPADGLDDIEFSPGPDDLFATVGRHVGGKGDFRGIHLVWPAKLGTGKPPKIESLDTALDIHTLLFSPKGKYVTWATKHYVKYRDPRAAAGTLVTVDNIKDKAGPPEINGFAWDLTEQRLLIAAGNSIYIHDPKTKTTTKVQSVGDATKTFTAEPDWRGDDIIFTAYNDIGAPFRR